MKKKPSTSVRGNKAALVATMLAVPMISTPAAVYSQRGGTISTETTTKIRNDKPFIKFDNIQHKVGSSSVSIIGVGDGHAIYEKPNGDKFYIESGTGDIVPVTEKVWIKMTSASAGRSSSSDGYIKFATEKQQSEIKIVGVDADGNVIHEKPDGTQFKVHTKTGHVTLMK